MGRMLDPTEIARAWHRAGASGPPVDVYETAEAVVIRLAIPGADGSSLSLRIGEDAVTVRGESGHPGARWGERTVVHRQEIPYGRFERSVPLPSPVDANAVRAQCKHGVLDITLPEQRGDATRTIPISVATP